MCPSPLPLTSGIASLLTRPTSRDKGLAKGKGKQFTSVRLSWERKPKLVDTINDLISLEHLVGRYRLSGRIFTRLDLLHAPDGAGTARCDLFLCGMAGLWSISQYLSHYSPAHCPASVEYVPPVAGTTAGPKRNGTGSSRGKRLISLNLARGRCWPARQSILKRPGGAYPEQTVTVTGWGWKD